MRRLCGSNSGRSVGWCGYMRIPHPALPFSNLPLPFFCIILTPPHSLSTVFSPKTGALSHRAVRGINIPDSNCIGEDRSTALRLSCPNDMPWSRPNGSSRAGQCFFLRPLLLVRGRGTLLDLGLGTLKKGLVVLANQRFALCFRSSTLACSQTFGLLSDSGLRPSLVRQPANEIHKKGDRGGKIGVGCMKDSGRSMVVCGCMRKRTANLRQSSRIAFSLRRRALLRLIAYAGIARRLEKCWGKTGVPVFLFGYHSFYFDLGCGAATPARRRIDGIAGDLS